jgi:hypothetical protein
MATVNSRQVVDEIIANEGRYPGDPLVVRIVEYNNQFNGAICWGLIYEGQDIWMYHKSPACHNPRIIFDHGITVNQG